MDWELSLPMPLQIVVDDVGWWSGEDGSAHGEPFRTGIPRHHVPADYAALVALGQQLGMRPLVAFVAGEWDRHNLLAALPSSNPRGERWDNSHHVGPWLDEAANIIRRGRQHLELAVHGLNHEFWDRGHLRRTEFHSLDGTMRPRELIVRHLEAFGRILEDNGLGPFPESFVPPALLHSFGAGERGMQGILYQFGVRFINTHFASLPQPPPTSQPFAAECGVMLVDRLEPFLPWNALAPEPFCTFDQPVLSLHWPNILHLDPARNLEVVERWAAYLRPFDRRFDGMLAPDTKSCWSQIAHRRLARVERIGVKDMSRKYAMEDLAGGDVMFAATGVTDGSLLRGIHFEGDMVTTHTVVMRSLSGTVRWISASHRRANKHI